MKLKSALIALSCLSSPFLLAGESEEFVIHLKNPEYSGGVIHTEKGGVITAPDLRIQAQKIEYTNNVIDGMLVQKVRAEGDLMLYYKGRTFAGEMLEFDLLNKTGSLVNGRTAIEPWYLGGERFEICKHGNLTSYGGYVTTCENINNTWEIKANKTTLTDESLLYARNVKFQVMKVPFLWLPAFKSNLRLFKDTPIRFSVVGDKSLAPRPSLRVRFYSTDTWNAYARLDYRIGKGPGGALESEYLSLDKRTMFQTRNYGANYKLFADEKNEVRFRFQGLFKTRSEDERSSLHVQWDRLSDRKMVSDFKNQDFEINTSKATYLEAIHYDDNAFASLTYRPQINSFQSLNQERPYGASGIRPLNLGSSGIISENYASGSFLKYTYANQIDDVLKDKRSGRLETMNTLYRPFSLGGFTLTPRAGAVGIYYSDSPNKNAVGQLLFTYGGEANLRFSKRFANTKHIIEPYAHYLGYTKPQTNVDDYFVFDIHDGYHKLDQLRFGLRQLFFSRNTSVALPSFVIDFYGYSFWGARSFQDRIPKLFADIEMNRPIFSFRGGVAWNVQEGLLDYGNARFLWTLSERVAFGIEYRHRSEFWWRKAIHDNFVVDFARPVDELLNSPLSDRRDLLRTHAHIRLAHRWQLHLQTHHGWKREGQPHYNGAKVSLFTRLPYNWQFETTYEYQPNAPMRFSFGWKMVE